MNKDSLPTTPILLTKAHIGPIYTIKFNKSGEYCMTGSEDRNVCLFNPSKNILIKTYKALHNYEISSLDINNDNSKFITGGGDKLVFLNDVIEGKSIRKYQGHTGRVNCVTFNDENNVIISGSYDTTVRCWDNKSNSYSPIEIIKGFRDSVSHILVNKFEIIASSIDGYIKTYDIRRGEVIEDYFKEPVHKFALSMDKTMMAVSCTNNRIYLVQKNTGSKLKQYQGHIASDFTIDVAFNKNDSHIISGSQDGSLYIYNILKSDYEKKYSCHSKALSALDIHQRGGLVTASHDGGVAYWKI